MDVDIRLDHQGGDTFRVTVTDSSSSSIHEVTIDTRPIPDLADDDLLRASFEFLLDREPKEAILDRFGLSVISRYFPDYEVRIGEYL